jgi:hypothetical protein
MEIEYKKDGIIIGGNFIKLSDIVDSCNFAKIKENNLVLLQMEWPSRRGFDGIEENIVLPAEKIEIIKKYIVGRDIFFGEIAGKHSDIYGTIEEDEFAVIFDPESIALFLKENPSGRSYNYSFLDTFCDYAMNGGYDDISEDDAKEFAEAY